ncbi:sensor histidine kinase [Vibrio hibernica]|uniref:sensor histidine kinase n=1 Tax=Vibrio hibernica TaxID=2587465 RepID=UPI0039AF9705
MKNKKPRSIKRNLVNSISLLFGVIIFAVYLSVDLSMDGWADSQFDKALVNKTNYLKSLVRVTDDKVDFDDTMMSESTDNGDIHYYQLWYQDNIFKRSNSLNSYPDYELLKIPLPLNTTQILDVRLPNGETGRASISYFLPDSELLNTTHVHPAYLALYESNDSLENMLLLLDLLLIVSFFFSIFLMRYIATRIVNKGLAPLQYLNQEIKKIEINLNRGESEIQLIEIPASEVPIEEIAPIRKELNAFITANQLFLQNEQRLTSDIAHELKTPIAEIMSLSEVYIRYPNDERIGKTYKDDMLKISMRMKNIVEKLLLLHRSSSKLLQLEYDDVDTAKMIQQVLDDLLFKAPNIQERVTCELKTSLLHGDSFSLNVIINNLLDNALFYSPDGSKVDIEILPTGDENQWQLQVRNDLRQPLSQQDIEHILDPMYQADSSRTSNERHGLGLAIVNNICKQNAYQLTFNTDIPGRIIFSVGPILSVSNYHSDIVNEEIKD